MSVKILSLDRWEKLSPKQRWDILVALRGPDQSSSLLKWFTSAVIRHAMQDVLVKIIGKGAGGMINDSLNAVVLPEWSRVYKEKGVGHRYEEVQEGDELVIKSVYIEPRYPRIAWFNMEHFVEHIGEAAQYLEIPIITIPPSAYEDIMSTEFHQGMGRLLAYLIESQHSQRDLLISHAAHVGVHP